MCAAMENVLSHHGGTSYFVPRKQLWHIVSKFSAMRWLNANSAKYSQSFDGNMNFRNSKFLVREKAILQLNKKIFAWKIAVAKCHVIFAGHVGTTKNAANVEKKIRRNIDQ